MPGMAGGGLPDAEQQILADASVYIDEFRKVRGENKSVEESNKALGESFGKLADDITKIERQLRDLGRNREIVRNFVEMQKAIDAAHEANQRFAANPAEIEDHTHLIQEAAKAYREASEAADFFRAAEERHVRQTIEANNSIDTHIAATNELTAARQKAAQVTRDLADAHREVNTALAGASRIGRGDFGGFAPVAAVAARGGGGDGGFGAAVAAAAGGGAGAFFGAMRPSTIFGGALPTLQVAHLVTMFTMEVLSTVIPAAVAAGAAGMVGLQAGQNLYQRGSSMWTAAEALGGAYGGQTLGTMVGLKSNLQKAQDLAQGGVYGIGGAFKDLIQQGGGAFTDMGVQTVAMINRGMTAMVLNKRMKDLMGAMSGGTGFLRMFGDIGANIGDTLLNLAPNLPGMGPMLFRGLEGITGAMSAVTGGIPGPLLGAGLAGEAGWRWGKLVLSGGKLPWFLGGGAVKGAAGLAERLGLGTVADAGAGVAGEGLAGLLGAAGGPLGLGLALTAFGISQAGSYQSGAQRRAAGWQDAINQSFGAGALTPITKALYSATGGFAALPEGAKTYAPTRQQIASRVGIGIQAAYAMSPEHVYTQAALSAAQQLGDLVAAGPDAVKALSGIGIKGATLTQAFEAMSMAMVSPQDFKGGKLDATARQQLQQFAQTYQTARIGGQPGMASGLLMGGAADYIMSSSGMKAILQTNQALDSMTQIMTGGPAGQANLFGVTAGAPAAVAQAMITAPGARLSTAQQNQIAAAMKGDPKAAARLMAHALSLGPFGGAGGAAWNQFAGAQGMMAAQQANMDQARMYMTLGAISGQQGAQLGAFDLQQLLPYAAQSSMAQAMIEQQAMQASIPGVRVGMKYSDLVKAISGTAVSQQGALGILTQGTKAIADLPAIAAELITGGMTGPSALQSALTAQMAQQALKVAGPGGITRANVAALTGSLAAGGVAPGKMQISVDAILRNLHVPSNMIAKINAEINPPKIPKVPNQHYLVIGQAHIPKIPKVPDQHFTIYGQVVISGATAAAAAAGIPSFSMPGGGNMRIHGGGDGGSAFGGGTFGHSAGYRVPGYGGGDRHLALLEGGEAVVPKHLVGAIAPYLSMHNVPGFQGGGFVGQAAYGPGAYWGTSSKMALWNPALLAELLAAIRASQGTGIFDHPQGFRGLLAGGGGGGGGSGSLPSLAQAAAQASLMAVAAAAKGGAGQQFGVQVIQGLTGHIKNLKGETATLAKELVNRLEQEVKYATGVANAAAYGQGYDPTGRGAGIFGSMTFTNSAGLTAAQLHSSPTGNIKDYNAYVAAFAAGDPGQAPKSAQQQMQDYLKTLRSFSGDITKLRKEHLNKDVMAQIIAAGPQQGDQIAQSILGGQGGVGSVNKLWQQIQKASKGLGAQAAMAQYGGHLSSDLRHGQVSIGGVTINVNVGGGHGGTLDLTPQQIAQIVAAVQAALLKQAKKNNKTGVKLPGKSA